MNIREIWQRITTSSYTRLLEAEVARLRAENRALLNSILGIAGVPPVAAEAAPEGSLRGAPSASPATEARFTSPLYSAKNAGTARARTSASQHGASVAIPTRRRSWQQINRMLELDSARKASGE
jgi:hypothetical protein